jgi:hypothetical protein
MTSVPTPRIRMELSRSSRPVLKVTLGITVLRSAMPSASICSSCVPLTTDTARGTRCASSVRFWAVTTTSSRVFSAALSGDPTASVTDIAAQLANRIMPVLDMQAPLSARRLGLLGVPRLSGWDRAAGPSASRVAF